MSRPIARRNALVRLCASAAALAATPGRALGLAGTAPGGRPAAPVGPPRHGRGGRAAWQPSAELLERLPEWMALADVPGIAAAVVEDGAVAWTGAFGLADAETSRPLREDSIFEAASLSKPPVAQLALRLVADGRLDLDRPLADYVSAPDLLVDPLAARITTRHVLSHGSGLQNWRFREGQELRTRFEPGTSFGYSGEGFVWLQRVLEAVTGRGFVALMRERVLEPLGMDASAYLWEPAMAGRTARPHGSRGDPGDSFAENTGRAIRERAGESGSDADEWRFEDTVEAARRAAPDRPPLPNFLLPNAAASLLTTAPEYARFLAAVTAPETEPAAIALPGRLRAAMLEPHSELPGPLAWGLGWGLDLHAGRRWIWHWGDNGNTKNFVLGDVDARRGILVLANGGGGHKVYQRFIAGAIGEEVPAFVWV